MQRTIRRKPDILAGELCRINGWISPEAEFLEEIQTKVLRVFLLASHSNLCSLELRFKFLKLTQPLTVSTVQLLYTVKEKGGKPDRKPYHLSYGLRNPYRNLKAENSQDDAHDAQKPQ